MDRGLNIIFVIFKNKFKQNNDNLIEYIIYIFLLKISIAQFIITTTPFVLKCECYYNFLHMY
jgi:hypothetical protein